MNITGIITEYNPLHKGHIYHIKESKRLTNCDGIVCIMSGNFVQRGIPSIIDKWSKTNLALQHGVDLVIELPTIYSLSSAEFFAFGSLSLLNSLGIINNLCFGSECGNINILKKIAKVLYKEPITFKNYLKTYLDSGLSYPLARSNALIKYFKDNYEIKYILHNSNNILGIEYCKSILKCNSNIVPYTIQRQGSNYNNCNLENNFSSATSIRNHLKTSQNINILESILPSETFNMISKKFSNNSLVFENSIFPFIKYKSFTNNNELENLPDVSEGLHNKIYKALEESSSYEDLISNIKSKRYTHTRISRILCQYFVGLESYDSHTLRNLPAPYAKILGFNNKGREILKEMKKSSSIPIYNKLPKHLNETLQLDIQGTRAYSLLNKNITPQADFTTSPIYFK
ncbi:nucleotidyltransferase [Clostridium novyi]|uniref:nucleotidyltransferase n=1 Tax=Clostridium novyi TaxID=1542 RepID=UPI000EA0FCB3|nr:nucleotidyltransferase [Clostridium novyi]AYF54771.1 nucleotidyltransferase [Clostridium novyi]